MQSVDSILQHIITQYGYSQQDIASKFGVAPATISRWVNGESQPRPLLEGQLREMFISLQAQPQNLAESRVAYNLPLFVDEPMVVEAVDKTLLELRESLHRRGRLSSRNEAIDEMSKLLFAHIMSNQGISRKNLLDNINGNPISISEALQNFVRCVFNDYLPESLCHEMSQSDFELKLKVHEDKLALEIVNAFEQLDKSTSMKGINLESIDILNDVFGKFLADSFVDEKQLGQYLTPSEVVKFMTHLALQDLSNEEFELLCNPEDCVNFGLILDPSCGVASFLTETVRYMRKVVKDKYGDQQAKKWVENIVTNVIIGIDKSERMMRLALTNMAMFGLPAAQLHLTNSLSRTGPGTELTQSLEGRVKLILTNPPFGAEFKGNDVSKYQLATKWATKPIKKINSELLFIERYIDWLAPGGSFLTIVPDSILTNKGIYEDLRSNLGGLVEIRSVTSLPVVTFGAAGTTTKTSILHVKKLRDTRSGNHKTFFAICNDIGYSVKTKNTQRTKQKNGNGGGELPEILGAYFSTKAYLDNIKWIENVENSQRWDANYYASIPKEIEHRVKHPTAQDIILGKVASLVNERTDPRRWGLETFSYIEISSIDTNTCEIHPSSISCTDAPSRARKLVHVGDVLVSTVRPDRRIIGVVRPDQDNSVCSTGLAVLRPKGINPLVLAHLLKTNFVTIQIVRNTIGIAYPAIDEQCLLDILLPIQTTHLKSLESLASKVLDYEEQARNSRTELESAVHQALENWKVSVNPIPKPHQ